jgi:hypothetical protein
MPSDENVKDMSKRSDAICAMETSSVSVLASHHNRMRAISAVTIQLPSWPVVMPRSGFPVHFT